MLNAVNPVDQVTAARLVEFLNPTSPWNRSLWSLSLTLTLREFLEAAEANRAGILSEESVKRLGSVAIRLIGKDPCILETEKRVLNDALRGSLRFDGLAYHTIAQMLERIESGYVSRWAAAFESNSLSGPERSSRSLATFLLDQGFSAEFLHSWWTRYLYRDASPLRLSEICHMAEAELLTRPVAEYEILVAFKNSPKSASGFPVGWMKSSALSQWLRENLSDVRDMRASGGLLIKVKARDPIGAMHLATARVDRFTSRASVATNDRLEPWPTIWVRGEADGYPLAQRPRGVRVKALYREDQIFSESDSAVDAALELLAHLETSSASAAIAGGWAAMEALLAEPHDRAGAAESFASVVACSFPRAELTTLSYTAARTCPDLKIELQECQENRERALVVARAILNGHTLNLRRHSDVAAHKRMQNLLRSPSKILNDIQMHVADALHRLYRQRNLILHGGRTNGIALQASLRTTAKLVGAGMDRITHAWYVQRLRPVELAARSRSAILLVRDGDPENCVNLLGI